MYAAGALAWLPTVNCRRWMGRAFVIAEDSRSTSRQPSRLGADSPPTSQWPAPSASSVIWRDPDADRAVICALRVVQVLSVSMTKLTAHIWPSSVAAVHPSIRRPPSTSWKNTTSYPRRTPRCSQAAAAGGASKDMSTRTGADVMPRVRRAAQGTAGRRPRQAEPDLVAWHVAGCHHGLLRLVRCSGGLYPAPSLRSQAMRTARVPGVEREWRTTCHEWAARGLDEPPST